MTLSRIPIWRGSRKLEESEDSPEITSDSNGLTVTQTYSGTYENCLSLAPAISSKITGFGDGVRVESTRVKRAAGGRGILVVVSKRDPGDDDQGEASPIQSPEITVDWQRVDVALANSSYFTTGGGSLNGEDWKQIKAWQAGESAHGDKYGEFKYQTNGSGNWTSLTGSALKYAQKLIKGIESVMVFVPVVTMSTPNSGPPGTGSCGHREAPPRGIPGYTFLKTADRCMRRNRRWTRDEEWTGFREIDPDLYP